MIIRPNICFNRNMNLFLVMQELHQDIAFLVLEKHNLNV